MKKIVKALSHILELSNNYVCYKTVFKNTELTKA